LWKERNFIETETEQRSKVEELLLSVLGFTRLWIIKKQNKGGRERSQKEEDLPIGKEQKSRSKERRTFSDSLKEGLTSQNVKKYLIRR